MWEPAEHRYFAERVEPLLGHDAVYVGEIGGRRKLALLAGAEALVNPIRWPEPFGLVMIEALACGTPVLTFAEGAAPEIIKALAAPGSCATTRPTLAAMIARPDLAAPPAGGVKPGSPPTRMVADHLAPLTDACCRIARSPASKRRSGPSDRHQPRPAISTSAES